MHRWVVMGSDFAFVGGTRHAFGSAVRWALWLGKCWPMQYLLRMQLVLQVFLGEFGAVLDFQLQSKYKLDKRTRLD